MIRTATLDIPNVGRVRPDFQEIVIQSACDGVGTVLARRFGAGSTFSQELMEEIREEIKKTMIADFETPATLWKDKGLNNLKE